jgi:hypothetical protein
MSRHTTEDLVGMVAGIADHQQRQHFAEAMADVFGGILCLGALARAQKGELLVQALRKTADDADGAIMADVRARFTRA